MKEGGRDLGSWVHPVLCLDGQAGLGKPAFLIAAFREVAATAPIGRDLGCF